MIIQLKNVRCSFLHVFRTDNFGRFSCAFLLDPSNKEHKAKIEEIEAAIEDVAAAQWGDLAEKILAQLRKRDRICLRDGNEKPDAAGYEDMMYIQSSNKAQPIIKGRYKEDLTEKDGKPFSGCYVNASVEIWAQDNSEGGRRINAGLRGVQYVRDGEPFGGGTPMSEDEFDDLGDFGDEEDEDDLA